jgi:hypothetical protein
MDMNCTFCWHDDHGQVPAPVPFPDDLRGAAEAGRFYCHCGCDGRTQWVTFYADTRQEAERLADEIGRAGYALHVWGQGDKVVQVPEADREDASIKGKFCAAGTTETPATSRAALDERRGELAGRAGVRNYL